MQWDAKERMVFVSPHMNIGKTEVWVENLSIPPKNWSQVRHAVTQYVLAYDSRDTAAAKKLLTSDFKSDIVAAATALPQVGQPYTLVDHKIVDAATWNKTGFKISVQLITQEVDKQSKTIIAQRYLDIDLAEKYYKYGYLIQVIWGAGQQNTKGYNVFPGLTYFLDK